MSAESIVRDPSLLVAIAEDLVPSLNGASAQRLAEALEADKVGAVADEDRSWLSAAAERVTRAGTDLRWARRLADLASDGVRLVTVRDDDYPSNLRMVADRPPLLFVRGSLTRSDDRAIAVVGTRKPSEAGVAAAYSVATELAARGVTVVSGLAEGIDTAAHRAALDAGGRTIAVFGTGIGTVYPRSNRSLATRVAAAGACVSQFLPDMRGTRWSFPVRNVVTSGLSIGTVIVEAGETSGARIQAQDALRHAKRLFLLRSLVSAQPWAAQMADTDGVAVVDDLDEIMTAIEAELTGDAAVL